MRKSFYERLKKALQEFREDLRNQEMVEFNYILNEDQEKVLELQNELGEKDVKIHELELQVTDLEKTIKAHYGNV